MSSEPPVQEVPESVGSQPAGMPRSVPMAGAAAVLALAVVGAWFALQQIERRTRENVGESLRTVAEATHESLQAWFQNEREYAERLFQNPHVRGLTEKG